MKNDIPSKQQIEYRLKQGHSYAQSIDGVERNVEVFNKYANFKMKTVMSDNSRDDNRIKPEEINEETFRWRTADKEFTLDEMDLDLKLAAATHALKHANRNFSKYNNHSQKADHHNQKAESYHENTEYFMKLFTVLESSLANDHNVPLPSEVQDIRSMRKLISQGIMTVENKEAKKEYKEKEENKSTKIKDPKKEEQESEKAL